MQFFSWASVLGSCLDGHWIESYSIWNICLAWSCKYVTTIISIIINIIIIIIIIISSSSSSSSSRLLYLLFETNLLPTYRFCLR
jgi:hypothetical protein